MFVCVSGRLKRAEQFCPFCPFPHGCFVEGESVGPQGGEQQPQEHVCPRRSY